MDTSSLASAHLDEIPALTQQRLAEYFAARRQEVAAIGQPVTEAVGHLEQFVLGGGKRIRPLYTWAGFMAARGFERTDISPASVLDVAASLELIQACALIHDDIIDASDTRRGQATVHRRVETHHRENSWLGNSQHFGESVAILVGDIALIWAEDLVQDSGLPADALARTREPWRAMRTEVIGGQLLDITLESSGNEDIQLAHNVNRFKTAAYTIERPLHLGAAIAGAEPELIKALRGYGRDIGVAFQLRDDLLGIYGDPTLTGKPAGDDLREGKRTVLLATALDLSDTANPTAAAELRRGVGAVATDEEVSRLADIIADTGAVDVVEQRIAKLTQSGLQQLKSCDVSPEVSQTLETLALRSTERRS